MFNLLDSALSNSGLPKNNFTSIGSFVAAILNILMGIGFSIAIITIAYSGFLFANSSGDPKASKKAYDTLLYGAVAAAIVIGAVSLRFIVSRFIIGIPDPTVVPDY